jgi:hypothetical protein
LLIALDNAVGRFVNNPVFKPQKNAAPESSGKALVDPEEIIELRRALRLESKLR